MRKRDKEITEIHEIEAIIQKADVCRVAFANGDLPYIVTMNFGYTGWQEKKIYFHCAPEGRKLEMIAKNKYVCFEMDTDHELTGGEKACDFSMKFRSVVGYGNISVVDDPAVKIRGMNCIMSHYSENKTFCYNPLTLERTTVLCIEIKEITGKQS